MEKAENDFRTERGRDSNIVCSFPKRVLFIPQFACTDVQGRLV